MKARATLLLSLLALFSLGFEWQGRLARLRRELETGDVQRRREVVRMLGTYASHEVADALLAALGDQDASVRAEAAEAVGRVRLRDAVPRLLDWLDDEDVDVRVGAASALGRIGDPRTAQALVRALGDQSSEVRRAAVRALRALGTPEVVVPLLGRLDDADSSVQIEAAEALGELGDERAVVPLIGRARDQAPEVRVAVYAALGAIGDARAAPALLQGLRGDEDAAQLAAIAALGRLGAEAAVEPLAALVARSDSRAARAAVAALGAIGTEDALRAVVSALSSRDARAIAADVLVATARRSARSADASSAVDVVAMLLEALDRAPPGEATAIAEMLERLAAVARDERAAEPLLRALRTGRGATSSLLRALAATGSPDALVPILETLRGGDSALEAAALAALDLYFDAQPADGRAADPLLAALGRVDPPRRVAVVRLLGRVRAPRALPALRPLLSHREPALRLAAVQAIGAIGDPQGADALLPLLSDRDPRTRYEAARALAAAANRPVVEQLLERLAQREPTDRHAVVLALGGALRTLSRRDRLPAPVLDRVREALRGAAAGPDVALSARAIEALGALGSDAAAVDLAAIAENGTLAVRRYAAHALGLVEGDRARATLRDLLGDRSVDVAGAAATALGENGTADDVGTLLGVAREGAWPATSSASFALARLARRGMLTASDEAREGLCALASARDPYLVANAIVALASINAPPCSVDVSPERFMDPERPTVIRVAAARWVATSEALGESERAAMLDRCVARELSSDVTEACRAPTLPALSDSADVYAYSADGRRLLVDTLVGLRLADGSVLVANTDATGHLYLEHAPHGPLVLDDPTDVEGE